MNNRGQTAFDLIFIVIVFFLLLGGGLGYFINSVVGVSMGSGAFSGIEAFFISNWLLWIILAFILAVLWRARG